MLQSNLEEKDKPSIFKDGFISRTGPSILTSELFSHWFCLLIKNTVHKEIDYQWMPFWYIFLLIYNPKLLGSHLAYFFFATWFALNGLNFEWRSSKKSSNSSPKSIHFNNIQTKPISVKILFNTFLCYENNGSLIMVQ